MSGYDYNVQELRKSNPEFDAAWLEVAKRRKILNKTETYYRLVQGRYNKGQVGKEVFTTAIDRGMEEAKALNEAWANLDAILEKLGVTL